MNVGKWEHFWAFQACTKPGANLNVSIVWGLAQIELIFFNLNLPQHCDSPSLKLDPSRFSRAKLPAVSDRVCHPGTKGFQ